MAHSLETNLWKDRAVVRHSRESGNPVLELTKTLAPPTPCFLKNSPTLLHIQDVHLNAEAQAHIGDTLEKLINENNVDLIALEGAFGPIDFKPFKAYPYQDTVKKVADELLNQKKMSGAVHAGFVAHRTTNFVGVDDLEHYLANVEAYKQSTLIAKKTKADLTAHQYELQNKKRAIFNSALIGFDQKVEAYSVGKLSLGDYLRNFSPSHFQIELFLSAYEMESSLNFPQVELERSHLLARLTNKLSKEQNSELTNLSFSLRAGEISQADFYARLKSFCDQIGVPLKKFPALNKYVQYVLLSAHIDPEKLFAEMKQAENETYASLIKTDKENELVAQSRFLRLAKKLVGFSLTKDEWAEYKSVRSAQCVVRSNGTTDYELRATDLKPFENFYREAEIRDQLMAKNLSAAIERTHAKNIVLVTGGFHTRGIDQQLKTLNPGLSTVSFVPHISKIDDVDGSSYLSAFAQEKTPLEKLFSGNKLFLSTPNMTLPFREYFSTILITTDLFLHHILNAAQTFKNLVPDGQLSWEQIQRRIPLLEKQSIFGTSHWSFYLVLSPLVEEAGRALAFHYGGPWSGIVFVPIVLDFGHYWMDRNKPDYWGHWAGRFSLSYLFSIVYVSTYGATYSEPWATAMAWGVHVLINILLPNEWKMSVINIFDPPHLKVSLISQQNYAAMFELEKQSIDQAVERNGIAKILLLEKNPDIKHYWLWADSAREWEKDHTKGIEFGHGRVKITILNDLDYYFLPLIFPEGNYPEVEVIIDESDSRQKSLDIRPALHKITHRHFDLLVGNFKTPNRAFLLARRIILIINGKSRASKLKTLYNTAVWNIIKTFKYRPLYRHDDAWVFADAPAAKRLPKPLRQNSKQLEDQLYEDVAKYTSSDLKIFFGSILRELRAPRFVMRPGMHFGDSQNFWNQKSREDHGEKEHWGLDLVLFQKDNGQVRPIPPMTRIPFLIDRDRIIDEHAFDDNMAETVAYTYRAGPFTLIAVKMHIKKINSKFNYGAGLIERSKNPNSVVTPHLHFGIGVVMDSTILEKPMTPAKINDYAQNNRIIFLDPEKLLGNHAKSIFTSGQEALSPIRSIHVIMGKEKAETFPLRQQLRLNFPGLPIMEETGHSFIEIFHRTDSDIVIEKNSQPNCWIYGIRGHKYLIHGVEQIVNQIGTEEDVRIHNKNEEARKLKMSVVKTPSTFLIGALIFLLNFLPVRAATPTTSSPAKPETFYSIGQVLGEVGPQLNQLNGIPQTQAENKSSHKPQGFIAGLFPSFFKRRKPTAVTGLFFPQGFEKQDPDKMTMLFIHDGYIPPSEMDGLIEKYKSRCNIAYFVYDKSLPMEQLGSLLIYARQDARLKDQLVISVAYKKAQQVYLKALELDKTNVFDKDQNQLILLPSRQSEKQIDQALEMVTTKVAPPGTMLIETFLEQLNRNQTLPWAPDKKLSPQEVNEIVSAHFTKKTNYIATLHKLTRCSQLAIENLKKYEPHNEREIFIRKKINLIAQLMEPLSHDELLKELGQEGMEVLDIVDRHTEIIHAAEETRKLFTNRTFTDTEKELISLINYQTRTKRIRDIGLLMSDGVIRTRIFKTPAEKLDERMAAAWNKRIFKKPGDENTIEVDVLNIGGGPASFANALHAMAAGEKVAIIDKGHFIQSFSDFMMQSVHWMRSNSYENSLLRDSILELMNKMGLVEHLPWYRNIGRKARQAMKKLTGQNYMGLPWGSNILKNASQPNSRNELFMHFAHILDYMDKNGAVLEEQAAPVDWIRRPDGKHVITTRDGRKFVANYVHLATGMVGSNAEYARTNDFMMNLPHHLAIRTKADLSLPTVTEKLDQLIHSHGPEPMDQVVFSDALLGSGEMKEVIRKLKPGTKIMVVGSGESAFKAAVECHNLNGKIEIDLIVKELPPVSQLHISKEQTRRHELDDLLRSEEKMAAAREKGKKNHVSITFQTDADVRALEAQGLLRLHVLGDYFDENNIEIDSVEENGKRFTRFFLRERPEDKEFKHKLEKLNAMDSFDPKMAASNNNQINTILEKLQSPHLSPLQKESLENQLEEARQNWLILRKMHGTWMWPNGQKRLMIAKVDGPKISAIGYDLKAGLQKNPFIQLGIKNGILKPDLKLSRQDDYLTFEDPNGLPGTVFVSGPLMGHMAPAYKSILHDTSKALQDLILRVRQRILKGLVSPHDKDMVYTGALRTSRKKLTDSEEELYNLLMTVIHSDEYGQLVGQDQLPYYVYKSQEIAAVINGKQQWPVPTKVDKKKYRSRYLEDSLRGDVNLELIPNLRTIFGDPIGFTEALREKIQKFNPEMLSDTFQINFSNLKNFVNDHRTEILDDSIELGDIIAKAGRDRKVIFMDSKIYEALFSMRSSRNASMFERKKEPLLLQVLENLRTHYFFSYKEKGEDKYLPSIGENVINQHYAHVDEALEKMKEHIVSASTYLGLFLLLGFLGLTQQLSSGTEIGPGEAKFVVLSGQSVEEMNKMAAPYLATSFKAHQPISFVSFADNNVTNAFVNEPTTRSAIGQHLAEVQQGSEHMTAVDAIDQSFFDKHSMLRRDIIIPKSASVPESFINLPDSKIREERIHFYLVMTIFLVAYELSVSRLRQLKSEFKTLIYA